MEDEACNPPHRVAQGIDDARHAKCVVTPNIVTADQLAVARRDDVREAMPATAKAALRKTIRLTLLRPARSVIEGVINVGDIYERGDVAPEASVETINFGRPIGSARMPRVMIEVLALRCRS